MPKRDAKPDAATIDRLLSSALGQRIVRDTESTIVRDLIALMPQLPVLAQTLGISVIGLIVSVISRGMHGVDNRMAIDKLDPLLPIHAVARRAANGVAFVSVDDALSINGNEAWLATAKETMNGQFKDELCVATSRPMTAFLVAPKYAVTAGHAVCSSDPTKVRLVFGFRAPFKFSTGKKHYRLPVENVVRVRRVIALQYDERLGDIALLELAKRLPKAIGTPLRLAPAGSTKFLHEVAALSHARGQPLKAVIRLPRRAGAKQGEDRCFAYPLVLDQNERMIGTNLDTYRGSSGSPIIDAFGRVVGVQVRGLLDHHDGQVISHPEMFPGSWATRIETIADALAGIGAPLPPA